MKRPDLPSRVPDGVVSLIISLSRLGCRVEPSGGPLLAGGRGMSRRIQPVVMVELKRVILSLFRWLLFIMLAAVVASA